VGAVGDHTAGLELDFGGDVNGEAGHPPQRRDTEGHAARERQASVLPASGMYLEAHVRNLQFPILDRPLRIILHPIRFINVIITMLEIAILNKAFLLAAIKPKKITMYIMKPKAIASSSSTRISVSLAKVANIPIGYNKNAPMPSIQNKRPTARIRKNRAIRSLSGTSSLSEYLVMKRSRFLFANEARFSSRVARIEHGVMGVQARTRHMRAKTC
jgi:hypothetical protein